MLKLLFAEDERATREGVLENIDWKALKIDEVRAEKNGLLAYETAKNFVPDILLTDIKMPKMNGIELAQHVRELNPDCSILIISSYSEVDYLKSAIRLNAVDFVDKPLKLDHLSQLIAKSVKLQEEIKYSAQIRPLSECQSYEDAAAFLIDYIDNLNNRLSGESGEAQDPLVQEIIEIIRTSYFEKDLSLDEISKRVFLSPSYICVRFKKYTNTTLVQYLQEFRIRQSLFLLADPLRKLDDIGEAVGFDSGNYYSKIFKKHMGVSPAEYRNK